MSGHGQHDAEDHHSAHDDDHHHETTSDDFPPDEPRSPSWLPLLGGALLLAGIFAGLILNAEDKPSGDAAPNDAAPAAAPSANRPTAAIRPVQAFPNMPKPAGHP